jgi:hypothetical protein
MQTTLAVDRIIQVLSPYLGESMARASIRGVCEKLGLQGDALSAADADALVSKLASGLRVFIGREKTDQVVVEMKRALDGEAK